MCAFVCVCVCVFECVTPHLNAGKLELMVLLGSYWWEGMIFVILVRVEKSRGRRSGDYKIKNKW